MSRPHTYRFRSTWSRTGPRHKCLFFLTLLGDSQMQWGWKPLMEEKCHRQIIGGRERESQASFRQCLVNIKGKRKEWESSREWLGQVKLRLLDSETDRRTNPMSAVSGSKIRNARWIKEVPSLPTTWKQSKDLSRNPFNKMYSFSRRINN